MKYHVLREIADSWVLLAMFAFFVGAVFWAFRPGSRTAHSDAANVPFRHEDKPARDIIPTKTKRSEGQS
jgi:cytochrome c oxidase cbb3-type subunit 4